MHKREESELEMVRRHVRDGVEHVARQRRIVAGLHSGSLLAEIAEQLLATFEEVQRQHMAHLARLKSRSSNGPPSAAGPSPVRLAPAMKAADGGFRFNKLLQHWEGLARIEDAHQLVKELGGTARQVAAALPVPAALDTAAK